MIDLTQVKEDVKELVEHLTELPAYYDIVPLGCRSGALLVKGNTTFEGRTIDGDAHVAHHSFDVILFSFENAETVDKLTSDFVNATEGKYSEKFQLIEVTGIDPIEYDQDVGFWANSVSMEFVVHGRRSNG